MKQMKKNKILFFPLFFLSAASVLGTLNLSSCSYTRPQMLINGPGGTLFEDTDYLYALSWKGIYDHNITLEDFRVEFFDDNNGQVGSLNSKHANNFIDWHITNDDNGIQKEHQFVLRSKADLLSSPDEFWVKISCVLDSKVEATCLKEFSPYDGYIKIDMDVNDQSDPSKYCSPLIPLTQSIDGYAILLNSELSADEGYIFDNPTSDNARQVWNRLCADVIYESQDAKTLIPQTTELPIQVDSFDMQTSFNYDLGSGKLSNLDLEIQAHISLIGLPTLKADISISCDVIGEYIFNGAFSIHPWETQYYWSNVQGNYLSLQPCETGSGPSSIDGPMDEWKLGSHYRFSIKSNSSLFPLNADYTKFVSGDGLLGITLWNEGLYIKSYYLSEIPQLEKVRIKEFSYSPDYYKENPNYAPKVTKPNGTAHYPDADIDYSSTNDFQTYLLNYYESIDSEKIKNYGESYLDDSTIIRSQSDNQYQLTISYGDNKKTKSIPWYWAISAGGYVENMSNTKIPDWNGLPYLYLSLNYVYSPQEGPDKPISFPNPWSSDSAFTPTFFRFAFPPNVI